MLEVILWAAAVAVVLGLLVSLAITALQYPYDTDEESEPARLAAQNFYQRTYVDKSTQDAQPVAQGNDYVELAQTHAGVAGIPDEVRQFVLRYGLTDRRVLDVGAGSGLLQDLVEQYTAIDLSSNSHRFFHKPFVAASAARLPFRNDTFDGLWSIWMLEHVPNPERVLEEIRRVVRPGGYVFLRPAWDCDPWAAEGYEVRPYGELPLKGKLIKATIPMRVSRWYAALHVRQVRAIRTWLTALSKRPSRLHFRRLQPNYERYWVTDSDAAVALDFYEVALWFTSRGDECENCPSLRKLLFGRPGRRTNTLIVRINKPQPLAHQQEESDGAVGPFLESVRS